MSFFMGISPFSSFARNRATDGIIQHKEALDTSSHIRFREKNFKKKHKKALPSRKKFISS
ncbi:MAG: hypothetical protein ACLTBF_04140 [Christensenellales bacterium]